MNWEARRCSICAGSCRNGSCADRFRRLHPVGLVVYAHRPELDAAERAAVFAAALLNEEYRAFRSQLDAQGHEEIDDGEECAEEGAGYRDVERAFDETVRNLPQRLFADIEDRYVAQQFEVHRAFHVVAQVGHIVEPHEIVFAVVHDREYLLQIAVGGEAAVHLVDRMAFQPRQGFVYAAQTRGVAGQGLVVMVAEKPSTR